MTDSKILTPEKDPMGAAILEYQTTGKAGKLSVLSSMFEEDEMPVKHLFRNFEDMPKLEQTALKLAKGHVLDVGAGAGCHALTLQKWMEDASLKEKGNNSLKEKYTEEKIASVKAIDISPLSCEAMKLETKRSGKKPKEGLIKGETFDWLYVDFPLLKSIAESCGLHCELIEEGEHYDYLARIYHP